MVIRSTNIQRQAIRRSATVSGAHTNHLRLVVEHLLLVKQISLRGEAVIRHDLVVGFSALH